MNIKRIIAPALLLAIALSLVACGKSEGREISCEDIIKAYEEAGYTVAHHIHRDDAESDIKCKILIEDPDSPKRNYLYIDRYSTAEGAKEADKGNTYNPAIWIIAALHGEWRWLKSEHYNDIHYSSYNKEIIKPLKQLIRQSN